MFKLNNTTFLKIQYAITALKMARASLDCDTDLSDVCEGDSTYDNNLCNARTVVDDMYMMIDSLFGFLDYNDKENDNEV